MGLSKEKMLQFDPNKLEVKIIFYLSISFSPLFFFIFDEKLYFVLFDRIDVFICIFYIWNFFWILLNLWINLWK